jgi:hypothetical protein
MTSLGYASLRTSLARLGSSWLAPVVLLAGCQIVNTDQGTDDPGDTLPDCGDTPPAFSTELQVADKGTQTFQGAEKRAVQVSAGVTDADGDLFTYTVRIWYDTLVDGKFSQAQPQVTLTVPLGDPDAGSDTAQPCRFDEAVAGAYVPMGEGDVPMGETVEFGLVIADSAGNPTNGGEPLIGTFTTPAE